MITLIYHCAGLLEGQRGEGEETSCCASSAEPAEYHNLGAVTQETLIKRYEVHIVNTRMFLKRHCSTEYINTSFNVVTTCVGEQE